MTTELIIAMIGTAFAMVGPLIGATWFLAQRLSRIDVHLAELRMEIRNFDSRIARLERIHDGTHQ